MGKNTGGPAFPVMHKNVTGSFDGICRPLEEVQMDGMNLRDYFAAKAICGIMGSGYFNDKSDESKVAHAYRIADEMLAQRNK